MALFHHLVSSLASITKESQPDRRRSTAVVRTRIPSPCRGTHENDMENGRLGASDPERRLRQYSEPAKLRFLDE